MHKFTTVEQLVMGRAGARACLLALVISSSFHIPAWGQEADTLPSYSYSRKLEKRIEVLEQTVKELQEHLLATPPVPSQSKGELSSQGSNVPGPSLVREPPQNREVRMSGYAFGDYYWAAGHHNPSIQDQNGFWLRRAYLTFDKEVSENIDTRLRFEVNSAGDFRTKRKVEPFVKDAYVRWRFAGNHQAYVGLSPTPTKEVVEKFWGYRSLEKTILDLQKLGSSRDFGVALRGNVDPKKRVRYHFMVANGSGTSSETDKGKKVLFSLAHYPSDSIIMEFYTDYEDRPDNENRRTFQGFLGYQRDWGRLGVQYAHQTRNGTPDLELDALSIFGVYDISSKVSLIGRYDRMFDPNPDGGRIAFLPFVPSARSNLFLAAIDLKVHKEFSLMPNVEVVRYDKPEVGTRPDTDVIPRLTFFYRF